MKNLFSLLCLVVLLGVSVNVMGQGTGINPAVGSVHTYSVTAPSGTPTYVWKVTTDPDFAATSTDLLLDGTVVSGSSTTSSITLTWENPDVASNTIYYLHLKVTAEASGAGCENRKVIAIQPKNAFTLDIANVDATGVEIATDVSVCAPVIASSAWLGTPGPDAVVDANKTSFNYNYGQTVFYYKITASGINFENTTWTPSITITKEEGTHSTQTIESKIGGTITDGTWSATPALAAGTTANTPTIPIGAGNNIIWLKVTVSNLTGTPANANENIADNDFTFLLNGTSADQNGNNPLITVSTVTQTQSARPNTGEIVPAD